MLLYAGSKFIAYWLWCWLGLSLFAPGHANVVRAAQYGAIRWALGLLFGLGAAVALGAIDRNSVMMLYIAVYVPLRIVEWGIMVQLIRRGEGFAATPLLVSRVWFWVIGGIVVSFASDFTSPQGMAGKFCVGRCLC